jgi:hypothetical protein
MTCQKVRHCQVQTAQTDHLSRLESSAEKRQLPKISTVGTVIGTMLVLLTLPVRAFAITLINDRAALGETDRVDWSSLGPVNPPFKVLPNNFSTTSQGGLGINVGIPAATTPGVTPPLVFQTSPSPGTPTNFANGDFVLFTGLKPGPPPAIGNPGPLTINFDRPVSAAGTQIAVDDTSSFTAFLSAFDRNNNLLGNFSIGGTSSLALDNSAQFLGISSDTANISRLVYSSSESNRAFGINALSISQPIPEPLTIFGTIIGGAAAWKMKKKLKSIDKQ